MNADQIKFIRTLSGLSQTEFAKLLNVDKTHLSKWERGVMNPSTKSVNKIVSLVGTDNIRVLNALLHSLMVVELRESIKQKLQNRKEARKHGQRH
ncbi:helix-turn-helix domain-containing protein [Bacillus sp. AS_5]|uniref:helix-turn-helix domain-containing protein n=1 Tax=unclassified Bacillus (in: firmicutes) TaxID=185979 RepID=UPI00224B67C3|nr:helix-turn-helix domain-containing protein [Bacillus sp. AS_3]MCW4657492.1 helix-turn-helix domain-containing protein [Bacillus sp. AS_3]MCX2704950.1 helix-turn-helix domain-containing protein [Bacillus sp. AS_5]